MNFTATSCSQAPNRCCAGSSVGKEGLLVDPDNALVHAESRDDFDAVVFGALDDAVAAAKVLQAAP
jgi:hypothetical protein